MMTFIDFMLVWVDRKLEAGKKSPVPEPATGHLFHQTSPIIAEV
jgi:hypothetical protein